MIQRRQNIRMIRVYDKLKLYNRRLTNSDLSQLFNLTIKYTLYSI